MVFEKQLLRRLKNVDDGVRNNYSSKFPLKIADITLRRSENLIYVDGGKNIALKLILL